MPYRSMSLEEFAEFVGMKPRDAQREADHGLLPGRKVGGQWRFNRVQVHDWLESHMLTLSREHLRALDRVIGGLTNAQSTAVTDQIGVEGINLHLNASTKASVLRELALLAEKTGLLYDRKELYEALREREAVSSTALPNGIAIPHPAKPMPYATAEPLICIARTVNPIGFGAADGQRTQLFFLICSHENEAHLHVLARLMRILNDETVLKLHAVEDEVEMLQLLIEREEEAAKRLR